MWLAWSCFTFIRDMNRTQPSTTRRETTYTDVGNADIASLHGKDCSYNPIAFPPSMEVRYNLVGQCICPWMDGQMFAPAISALPPSMVVVLGQRICTGRTVVG